MWRPLLAALALAAWPDIASGWRPSSYPEYCTKDIDRMAIPPLLNSLKSTFGAGAVSLDDVEMVQVQVVIRHGARTPFEDYPCWEGYHETWDCKVTELMVPTPSALSGPAAQTPPWLFRKLYDAFPKRNLLGGTCLVGQLILEGYQQELNNGKHLRDAYVCSGGHCLFPSPRLEDIGTEKLYLRSDDQQRVVMSGQLVALGLFEADSEIVLPWHTGDYSLDWMVPNPLYCPRLQGMLVDIKASDGWQELFYHGRDMAAVNTSIEHAWNIAAVDWDSALDCVMTSACTDRELPDTMDQQLFDDVVVMSERYENYKHLWSGGKYARVSMAPLVGHLRKHMLGALDGTAPEKFVLYAGHDTTLQPLLAAIAPAAWDGTWPAYASMMAIEVMRIKGQAYLRVVYNGRVLRVEGCSTDVCLVDDFIEATLWAENPERVCGIPPGAGWGAGTGEIAGEGAAGGEGAGSGGAQQEPEFGGGAMMAFAAACFIVGMLSGAAPTAMYYKRFAYERLVIGGGGNGHGHGHDARDSSQAPSRPAAVQFVGIDRARTDGIRSRDRGEANLV